MNTDPVRTRSGPADFAAQVPPRPRTSWAGWLGLLLVLGLAFQTRLGVVDQMLPSRPESDTHILFQYRVYAGQLAREDAPPHYGFYPTFVARTLQRVWGNSPFQPAPVAASTAQHLRAAAAPLVSLRAWIALAGVAAVAGLFFLTRVMQDTRAGLVASLCLATSLLHTMYSHEARPHGSHLPFVIWALFLLLRQIERPSYGRILATAVVAWMGMSTLQTGVFLLPPLAYAAAMQRARWTKRVFALLALGPAFVLSRMFYSGGIRIDSSGIYLAPSGHPIPFGELNGQGIRPTLQYLWGCEPVLLVLGVAGALWALGRLLPVLRQLRSVRSVQAAVLCAYGLPYLLFSLLNQETRDRYLLPLLPFLAMCAAFGLAQVYARLVRRSRPLAEGVCALALVVPLADAAKFYSLGRAPDTLELAARFLEQQPDSATARIVTSPHAVIPLRYTASALLAHVGTGLAEGSPWVAYQLRVGAPPAGQPAFDLQAFDANLLAQEPDLQRLYERLQAMRPTYVVLETSLRQRAFASHRAFETIVRAKAERVALINPEGLDPGDEELFEYGDSTRLRSRLWNSSALGPPLEIYRWNGP